MDAPRASAAKPPTGRKMKARAPPPPGKPAALSVHGEQNPPRDMALGPQQNLVHMKEGLRDTTVDVTVVLPSGQEKRSVLSGSHAMMDLLVELCLQNHLNPSHHALEIRSSETQQPLSFKPNTLVGTLNVHTVFLKEKVPEEKVKPGPPKVPEKSVRLVVNYLRTQKAVVRVSPEVPLQNILPVICAKCEVSPEHIVLLRDNIDGEELELSKSLNELGIKELYAWDNRRVLLTKTQSEPSLSCQDTFRKSSLGDDETDKEKKKILGFFKVKKRSNSKLSLGSQIDLQKKKRRAPAPPPPQPPPPSPLVPNRTEDKEENRRSTVVSLPLAPSGHCGMDGTPPAPSEAEETVSVSSCFASEDTTEDSGVMSSPSDIISLDSQHDSLKSKDRWATDQEDCSDQDLAGTPELGPQKSPSWERIGCGNSHPRTEKTVTVTNDDEDPFIAGQFHKTLAELDADLEEMEESYETDTSSLTSSLHGVSNHCTQDNVAPDGDAAAIPVTFIGEVSDDPVDEGLFSNRNNNAGSFDTEGAAGRRAHPQPFQEYSQQHVTTKEEVPHPNPPSPDTGKGMLLALSNTCKNGNSIERGPQVTSALKLHMDDQNAKEKGKEHSPADSERTRATKTVHPQPMNGQVGNNKSATWVAPSWCQRGQNVGPSYGLKHGLTTYKIVPPKSEMRCYDRNVSLSTGAIKIDELGNLVSPHVNCHRTISLSSSHVDTEAQPTGKAKEFWRCNSMEKPWGWPAESPAPRPTCTTTPAQPQPQESRLQAGPKPTPPQQPNHQEEGRRQPPMAIACHMTVPAANTTEVTFLKPQRRTSSQYVASAIAKRIGTPKVHANVVEKHSNAAKGHEGRAPALTGQPVTGKDGTTPSLDSEAQGCRDGTKWPCISPPNNHHKESAAGARPGGEVSRPFGKSSTQAGPAGVHKSSCFPLVTSSQRDHVSVGQSCGFSGKQSTSNQRSSSASNPKCTLDRTNPPLPCAADARTPSRVLANSSQRAPASREPLHSPKVYSASSHIVLEREEKPNLVSTDVHETDGTLPPNIFGPKKKFKPIVQRPPPKDTSLHSALMEAIHSAGGKDSLRKTSEHALEAGPKKLSYTESGSERSALLAAIRGHSGACGLKKVSSSASEELQSFRDAVLSPQGSEDPGQDFGLLPPPALPPPPPLASQTLSTSRTASRFSTGTLDSPVDARQALMDAIRSGTGAARLRKVPLLV
ncbi:protein cordon-bleu isoform X3 [Cynocephalus volans]|uniref:protein cordon-bleu isoform X3 n=1 Tax=Cynocephalus volans TaxID=110931 RepID=UPI002FC6E9DF